MKKDKLHSKYALVKEMYDTVNIVRNFNPSVSEKFVSSVKSKKGLFLTGEGSSRIFPAKRAIYSSLKNNEIIIVTEGATQSMEYDLSGYVVFGASNSGKTKEIVRLFHKLNSENHDAVFGLTAFSGTPVAELSKENYVLSCGKENAVAATKSVVEQALFYDSLLHNMEGRKMDGLNELADKIDQALSLSIEKNIIDRIKDADIIYFAGKNTGVVEELRLKTNEITRKKSDYLEGTYAVHGIEEVMAKNEVVIVIEPFEEEEDKFKECLIDGVGLDIIAISKRNTIFPTIKIPDGGKYSDYVELAAGWNVLVETGLALGIDLDSPERARKVGNEFVG